MVRTSESEMARTTRRGKRVAHKVLSNEKGRRGEAVVKSHIDEKLIPNLKAKEGWDIVTYCSIDSFQHSAPGTGVISEAFAFLASEVIPTQKLFDDFRELARTLNNTHDGFLLKLKKTGAFKSLRDGLSQLGVQLPIPNYRSLIVNHNVVVLRLNEEGDLSRQLPVVDGDIEFVEIKADRGWFRPSQIQNYNDALKLGFALRFFWVRFLSFEENKYEITEKLITDPN